MSLLLLMQTGLETQQILVEPASELTLSFWDLTLKGGWIMIPLALLWFIAVYLFIER